MLSANSRCPLLILLYLKGVVLDDFSVRAASRAGNLLRSPAGSHYLNGTRILVHASPGRGRFWHRMTFVGDLERLIVEPRTPRWIIEHALADMWFGTMRRCWITLRFHANHPAIWMGVYFMRRAAWQTFSLMSESFLEKFLVNLLRRFAVQVEVFHALSMVSRGKIVQALLELRILLEVLLIPNAPAVVMAPLYVTIR
jgi:hypothetical protein